MNKNDHPLISIIVPIYNAEAFLERCLSSIQKQHFGDFEVLMINDGSTDRSGAIAGEFAAQDSRFHLISQENQGVSAARNAGLEHSCGDLLLFVDSDDHITEHYTQAFAQAMSDLSVDLAISGYYECYESTGIQQPKEYGGGALSCDAYLRQMSKNPIYNYYGVLWNKCFRRELIALEELRFDSDCSYGEDFAFLMDYLKQVHTVRLISAQLYFYLFDRPTSLSKEQKDVSQRGKEVGYVYRKYCELWKNQHLYAKNRKRVQFYGAKLYFEESKRFPKEAWGILRKEILYTNGMSRFDLAFFESLRTVKHLLRIH